jgi:hypothetical protein
LGVSWKVSRFGGEVVKVWRGVVTVSSWSFELQFQPMKFWTRKWTQLFQMTKFCRFFPRFFVFLTRFPIRKTQEKRGKQKLLWMNLFWKTPFSSFDFQCSNEAAVTSL